MSERLSQEELDALLQAGLSDFLDEEEEEKKQEKRAKAQSYSPTQFKANQPKTDFKKTRLKPSSVVEDQILVQPAAFQPFEQDEMPSEQTNLEIILNLNLQIRVELGKTGATVGEVLKMVKNSVLELNKQNGEPVDLLVNDKSFAKGEMIVIGENFGVRVTDILTVTEIIEALR